jgi:hypothetical protein
MAFSARSVTMAADATMEYVMSLLSKNCTATEERCFLRGPCRYVDESVEAVSEEFVGW